MTLGPLIIVSGPSGSGKSTIIERLLADAIGPLHLSVSATTRAPRAGERDGVHYHYWPREQFDREVAAGGFLEWAEVFGNCYGTLKREVEPYRAQGIGVLLDVDVKGAKQVRNHCADAVALFISPPSLAVLEQRLRERRTETEETLQRRLKGAETELALAQEYDYQIINDDLDCALAQVRAIVNPLFERQIQNG
jgi:guanylate kinase